MILFVYIAVSLVIGAWLSGSCREHGVFEDDGEETLGVLLFAGIWPYIVLAGVAFAIIRATRR